MGSYGNNQTRAGLCYRISAPTFPKDLILQVTNNGGDVQPNDVDLLTIDGGFGLFNGCTASTSTVIGTSMPMFSATTSQWGATDTAAEYGGWTSPDQCSNLPAAPTCNTYLAQDNLPDLCRWSFANGFKANARISSICEVSCPSELWQATGIHRLDEMNTKYECIDGSHGISGGQVTQIMDCARPAYSGSAQWSIGYNYPTDKGHDRVIPCRRDGYTRINAMPASPSPTSLPTKLKSTVAPTAQANSTSPSNTGMIAGVAATVAIIGLCIAAGVFYWIFKRQSKNEPNQIEIFSSARSDHPLATDKAKSTENVGGQRESSMGRSFTSFMNLMSLDSQWSKQYNIISRPKSPRGASTTPSAPSVDTGNNLVGASKDLPVSNEIPL